MNPTITLKDGRKAIKDEVATGIFCVYDPSTNYSFSPGAFVAFFDTIVAKEETIAALVKELEHIVLHTSPKEAEGGLGIPGLATLNGARKAIADAKQGTQRIEE